MASKLKSNLTKKNPLDYMNDDIEDQLFLLPTSTSEISKLIRNLNINKSCGYDSISNKVLKFSCSIIAPFIAKLFNQCIQDGVFPSCFGVIKLLFGHIFAGIKRPTFGWIFSSKVR